MGDGVIEICDQQLMEIEKIEHLETVLDENCDDENYQKINSAKEFYTRSIIVYLNIKAVSYRNLSGTKFKKCEFDQFCKYAHDSFTYAEELAEQNLHPLDTLRLAVYVNYSRFLGVLVDEKLAIQIAMKGMLASLNVLDIPITALELDEQYLLDSNSHFQNKKQIEALKTLKTNLDQWRLNQFLSVLTSEWLDKNDIFERLKLTTSEIFVNEAKELSETLLGVSTTLMQSRVKTWEALIKLEEEENDESMINLIKSKIEYIEKEVRSIHTEFLMFVYNNYFADKNDGNYCKKPTLEKRFYGNKLLYNHWWGIVRYFGKFSKGKVGGFIF